MSSRFVARVIVAVFVASSAACSTPSTASSPAADEKPAGPWSLHLAWSGGKPPGTSTVQTLDSDGRFTSTRDGKAECELALDGSVMKPLEDAMAAADLRPGLSRTEGNVSTTTYVAFGTRTFALPSRETAKSLHDAIDAALADGATRCAATRAP